MIRNDRSLIFTNRYDRRKKVASLFRFIFFVGKNDRRKTSLGRLDARVKRLLCPP